LVRKPEGKRPLRRRRHIQDDNIRMHLKEIGWESVRWMYLFQEWDQWYALVNKVMDLLVP
jgi:ribosome biogenesis protein Nip4